MRPKGLLWCCNGDGRPVAPPSRVLCRECFERLDKKIRDLCAVALGDKPAVPK